MAQHHDAAHATADDQYLNTTEGSGHEHTDANVWMIVQFAIWLAVAALLTHLLMWGMFAWFVSSRNVAQPALEFPLAKDQERRLPAGPRLQAIPANEIFEFRQREDAELTEYGWVDRNAGTVRIPIEQAKALLLQRGLPSRAASPAAPEGASGADAAAMMPADSSSGRTLERRR
jgi:hypothetical protein